MVLNGEEGLECEVQVDGIRLEHVSGFKNLGYVLDESGTDEVECSRKVACGRRVAGAIRSLVNSWDLLLECARVLHETLLVPVFMYVSEKMLWKEERSRVRATQMDNLRGLLSIRRMDAWIVELCEVKKGLDERIDSQVVHSCEEDGEDRIAKRVYVGQCAGSCSVGRPWKRWIDTMKEYLKKRGLDIRQAMRMVQDRREWQKFVRGNDWGIAQGMNPCL